MTGVQTCALPICFPVTIQHPLGFPETPPPEMINGMHPDLVDGKKVADRFNRLDSVSANAMPLTGNPHIDKKILKARKQPK